MCWCLHHCWGAISLVRALVRRVGCLCLLACGPINCKAGTCGFCSVVNLVEEFQARERNAGAGKTSAVVASRPTRNENALLKSSVQLAITLDLTRLGTRTSMRNSARPAAATPMRSTTTISTKGGRKSGSGAVAPLTTPSARRGQRTACCRRLQKSTRGAAS